MENMYKLFLLATFLGPIVAECPHTWFQYKNKCFVFHRSFSEYKEAETTCRVLYNAGMVTIDNAGEQNYLSHLFFRILDSDEHVWLGSMKWINKSNPRQGSRWYDGSPVKYSLWTDDEEESKMNIESECPMMYAYSDAQGKWNTYDCRDPLHVACQKKMTNNSLITNHIHNTTHIHTYSLDPVLIILLVVTTLIIGILCLIGRNTEDGLSKVPKVKIWCTKGFKSFR